VHERAAKLKRVCLSGGFNGSWNLIWLPIKIFSAGAARELRAEWLTGARALFLLSISLNAALNVRVGITCFFCLFFFSSFVFLISTQQSACSWSRVPTCRRKKRGMPALRVRWKEKLRKKFTAQYAVIFECHDYSSSTKCGYWKDFAWSKDSNWWES
jgi:hypothetical protein